MKDLVQELYSFRDRFFETHPIEKASDKRQIVEQKMKEVLDKLDELSSNFFLIKPPGILHQIVVIVLPGVSFQTDLIT